MYRDCKKVELIAMVQGNGEVETVGSHGAEFSAEMLLSGLDLSVSPVLIEWGHKCVGGSSKLSLKLVSFL